MSQLFLIPIISVFDVHDVAIREWLDKLDESALQSHLEYPFKLDRFFPEGSQHALTSVDEVHSEILHLLDIINPQSVFLDISVDFVELENKYNKRLISPLEFWSDYYQISASVDGSHALYCVYIKGIIDKEIRLIESRDRLPLSVVFYGQDIKSREELIPIYEHIRDRDDEFLLQIARTINEIASFRELPEHLWYAPMQVRQMAISYEETEKFYNELLGRLKRLLKFKVRSYIVKSLSEQAQEFLQAYEKFLDYKMRIDELKLSNILSGLKLLAAQSEHPAIVIFCTPMHYCALLDSLKKDKLLAGMGIKIGDIDIRALLDKMRPFLQKNRIMQSNYDIALNILGRKKSRRFDNPGSRLIPSIYTPHLNPQYGSTS
jgi:hypothetical protein